MDTFSEDYKPEEYNRGIEPGKHTLSVKDIVQGTSKRTGNPMITIEFTIEGANFTVKKYFPKDEYFNSNMTKFFDCFGLKRGNFDYSSWIGRKGKAMLDRGEKKENGKQYIEIKYLIVEEQQENDFDYQDYDEEYIPKF